MKCHVPMAMAVQNSVAAPQIEYVDNHVQNPETFPATDSDPYCSFLVAEPMVATVDPTVAGDDEETNGEELVFRGSVEKRT